MDQEGNWDLIPTTLDQNYPELMNQSVYEVSSSFDGFTVVVRGAVVDGVVRIGTAWVTEP